MNTVIEYKGLFVYPKLGEIRKTKKGKSLGYTTDKGYIYHKDFFVHRFIYEAVNNIIWTLASNYE